jgi:hypothetical protein
MGITIIGKHTGDLYREDFPSLNVACSQGWWRPRHKREDGES